MRLAASHSQRTNWQRLAALLAALAVAFGAMLPGLHGHVGQSCDSHQCATHDEHHIGCGHADDTLPDTPQPHDGSNCEICKLILVGSAAVPPAFGAVAFLSLAPAGASAPHATHAPRHADFLDGLSARGPPTA